MKVLLVDDSSTMRRIQKNVLAKLGHTDIVEAEDGVAAQVKLEHTEVDLILLDWNMPNMDGLTLLKSIRACEQKRGMPLGEGVKVIMTTALDDGENVFGAFKSGCEAYVVKPIDKNKLLEEVRNLAWIE